MAFKREYQAFITKHLDKSKGERARRLKAGQGHSEKLFLQNVWWPLFHHFNFLHPEYEVADFKGGTRFLDFAYIRSAICLCFEIDGFGPHLKDVSRWQFNDNLTRQNHLILDGWTVLRFSSDQVNNEHKQCQQIIQQMIGNLLGEELDHLPVNYIEKEIIRQILKKDEITPKEVCHALDLSFKTVQKILSMMFQKNILLPARGTKYICSYKLNDGIKNPFFK